MSEEPVAVRHFPLDLLPYQTRIVEFLKRHDRDVWNWFASSGKRGNQAEEVRFELLKSTYRIDRDSQPGLYATADEVARTLGLHLPLTIYQAQDPAGLNASLVYLPDEIHVVLHGPITAQLAPLELQGLLAHELTHFLLCQGWNGELLIAADVLAALTNDRHAHPAHFASWRLLRIYNEVVCDRGAYIVTNDVLAVVAMLVKIETGVQEINAESYLRQADEIFTRGTGKTEGITHPEAFIRARAVKLWSARDAMADSIIAGMIEGGTDLKELDLLGQEAVACWTRRVVDLLLSHKWLQTDPVLAHARLYFEDYQPPSDALVDAMLSRDVRLESRSFRDYFCFVLLDFVAADRQLEEAPLAAALAVAEQLGIKERFMELVRQELRLRKNQIEKVDDKKAAILQDADKTAALAP